jgi:catecholate siderophore receptor
MAVHAIGWGATPVPVENTGDPAAKEEPVRLPGVVVDDTRLSGEVSSPKYTQPVADVPQTIQVIPASVFAPQGAATLTDILRNTPGITLFAGEGGSANRTGGDSFYLRGFDTSNSIFVDGVREEGALVHDAFNIGQVEVFKGSSADNGRGGTAGYVNLETKTPENAAFGDAQLAHGFGAGGSLASDRATVDVNEPLGTARNRGAAFRLNLMEQSGGIPGRDYARNDRWGAAPSLALGLGTPARAYLAFEHLHEHNLPDYGLPSTAVAGIAPPAAPSLYSPGVDPSTYYGFVDYDFERVTNDAATARLERDFGPGLKVRNQTRYDATSRLVEATSPSSSATTPAGQVSLSQGIYETKNEIVSNQTGLTAGFATGLASHSLAAGLELSRETSDNPTWSVVAAGEADPKYLVDIRHPQDFPASLINYAPHRTGGGTHTRIDTGALYAFDTVKLGPSWEAVAGVRVERYDIGERSVSPASPAVAARPASSATAATSAVAANAGSATDLSAGKGAASWKLGLVFKPAREGTLYASYATSVRPPGASSATNTLSTSSASADNPLLEPERAVNAEAGVKWSFFGERLLAFLALFKSVNGHVPATDPVTGLVNQTSDQTVRGGECGVSGAIPGGWRVSAGFSLMEAKVSDEISANAQGLTLPLLPRESGNAWVARDLPRGFSLGAGLQYMGETRRLQAPGAPTAATFSGEVPSYWLFNAMASWEANRHLTLRLNVANAMDRDYIASLNNNGYRVNLGAPRTFLLTAETKF